MQPNTNDVNLIRANQLKDEFPVGSTFELIDEFSILFFKSATIKLIPFIVKNKNSKNITLACKVISCSFKARVKFYASKNQCIISHINTIYSCEAIYARVKIAAVSDIILQSELTNNTSQNNLISLIRRDYGQDGKYMTAQKALSSYKLKNKIVLNNSCHRPFCPPPLGDS
ncbi:hypothetical protein CDIK_2882 [Cucumispora dikerogammari]|nr:hypothetical protein CDIK_2882 [Cucumispora dikerogammari]